MILLEGEEKGACQHSYSRVWMILLEGEKRCVRQHSYSRVWMILLEGEEKGAYANIVTVGCG